MPRVPPEDLAELFSAVLAGRTRLVGWGAIDAAYCFAWQCPLPLDYLVDTNPTLWGATFLGYPVHPPDRLREEDPSTVVIVTHYHVGWRGYETVTAFLERVGPFRHVVPAPLDQAFRPPDGGPDAPAALAGLRDLVAGRGGVEGIGCARALIQLKLTEERWRRFSRILAGLRGPRLDRAMDRRRRAVLLVERMVPGGAERQLCELAMGLKGAGWEVTLVALRTCDPAARHYLERLGSAGVDSLLAESPGDEAALRAMAGEDADDALALWHMPGYLGLFGFAVVRALRRLRPELLISYLDRPNVVGGVAGVLAGVPRILLSGRNLHPGHLPHLFGRQPADFREIYRLLAPLPGVHLSANAKVAADSYAEWIGVARERVTVVANAVAQDALRRPSPTAVAAMRASLAPAGRRIVLGVFRLSAEKRPDLFLEVFARLAALRADAHAVICGQGELGPALAAHVAALGLDDRVNLAGVVEDIPAAMRAADLLLHTSRCEGMPNALLEAQAQALPVVCVRNGGNEAVLAPALLEYAHREGDWEGLVASALRLLDDPIERRRLGEAGARHVRVHHTLERLVEDTLAAVELSGAL